MLWWRTAAAAAGSNDDDDDDDDVGDLDCRLWKTSPHFTLLIPRYTVQVSKAWVYF